MDNLNYVISAGSDAEAAALMRGIGVPEEGITLMAPRTSGLMVKLVNIDALSAGIIKQEMLFLGGDAALPEKLYGMKGRGDILLMGTSAQIRELGGRLALHHGRLPDLGAAISLSVSNYMEGLSPGFSLPEPLSDGNSYKVMGVLNVTADSFHDGGRYLDAGDALERARRMIAEGADIIDIGGESTRPGSRRVQLKDELERVVPVVEAIASQTDASISVDTSKAEVARQALAAGAHMINDVTALKGDRKMAAVVAEAGCPVCLMHMQGKPATMQEDPVYRDVIGDIAAFLSDRAAWAESKGIARDKIIIDPGIGFGKRLEHNLEIIDHLDSFLSLGMPLMIGTSRKSFLGTVLGGGDSADRLAGTVSTTVMAYEKGARIFRVHDVRENIDALRVVAAVGGRHGQ